jgi:hypothetical protein
VKDLRIALDGCYPSFWHTDLVMRTIRTSFRPQLVSRLSPHDLLIRGPFSRGNKRLRITDAATQLWQGFNKNFYQPLSLHVSSENHTLPNYQSYIQSGSDFGIGHELTNDITYLRSPHWHNYIDFLSVGIEGPKFWPRLGRPIQVSELTSPINWNQKAAYKAAFVCSNMTHERLKHMEYVDEVVPIEGFGKAFNFKIHNHSQSGFLKRDLLSNYQYCFCPENSLAPGYYTEKIPESYISGSIPITYCDPSVYIDFSPAALINIHSFFAGPVFNADVFREYFFVASRREILLETPLITYDLFSAGVKMLDFISNVCSTSLS